MTNTPENAKSPNALASVVVEAPTKPDPSRADNGKFIKGHNLQPSPEQRKNATIELWKRRMQQVYTAEDIDKVLLVLLANAKAGQPWAVELFLNRTLGKVREEIDVTQTRQFRVEIV